MGRLDIFCKRQRGLHRNYGVRGNQRAEGFYKGSQITATGKITKIDPGMATFRIDPDYNKAYYTVTIGKGMKLLVVKEQLDGLAVGDEVIFNGLLADGIDTDYLYISGVDVENCLTLATEAETSIPT